MYQKHRYRATYQVPYDTWFGQKSTFDHTVIMQATDDNVAVQNARNFSEAFLGSSKITNLVRIVIESDD
jgi:hypothetical protein